MTSESDLGGGPIEVTLEQTNRRVDGRLINTQILSQVALALIVSVAAFQAFALDARELSLAYGVVVWIGVALLVGSCILGGRGVARIAKDCEPGSFFDQQAKACLSGFCVLSMSFFLLGTPVEAEEPVAVRLGILEGIKLQNRLYELEEHIRVLTSHSEKRDECQARSKSKNLNERKIAD